MFTVGIILGAIVGGAISLLVLRRFYLIDFALRAELRVWGVGFAIGPIQGEWLLDLILGPFRLRIWV